MEVTIETKEVATPTTKTEEYQDGFFKTRKTREIAGEAIITFEVHLFLTPTEEERAVIRKFRLSELIVEEQPHYSDEQIEEQQKLLSATTDPDSKASYRRMIEEMRNSKTIYRIENYFDNPHVRVFGHPRDAHKYIDKLKEDVLPIIKSNLDYFSVRSEKETFTL